MRTEKRHAKVGERILIGSECNGLGHYKKDDILKVIQIEGNRYALENCELENGSVFVEGVPFRINEYEYEVIIEEDILSELEAARKEMNDLGEEFGLMHQKVIEASQRLDRIINRYEASRKEPE